MKTGRTIGAERARPESESERMAMRARAKRKKFLSLLTFFAVVLVLLAAGAAVIMTLQSQRSGAGSDSDDSSGAVEPKVAIVDEAGVGVSRRVKEFVVYVEEDLSGYGYTVSRAVLPRNKTREVDVYVSEFSGYFKLSLDRGAGVSAEDVDRMIRYLSGLGFSGAEYVDVRIAEKAYYRGAVSGETTEPVVSEPVETEVVEVVENDEITEVEQGWEDEE